MQPEFRNPVLGSGYVFFDTGDGELLLAETPGFELNVESTTLDFDSDDGPVAETLLSVSNKTVRGFNFSTKNIIAKALAMFLQADESTITTTVGSVTGKAIHGGAAVKGGYWYQLGVDATHEEGVRDITWGTIDTGATEHVEGTDYIKDAALARVFIVEGGGCDGQIITSDYATKAVNWERIATNDLGPLRGTLRYLAHNTAGENRDLFVPNCLLVPNGPMQFKSRTDLQALPFQVKVQKPTDGRKSVYLNGRAYTSV